MSFIEVENEQSYHNHVSAVGENIVVLYFTATWCGACMTLAPALEQFVANHPTIPFLKVDVEKCPEIATIFEIYLLPTFVILKNHTEVFRLEGSNLNLLESRILQESPSEELEDAPKGLGDLNKYIRGNDSECLNESNSHRLTNALKRDNEFLQSDVDSQLIISLTFSEVVKIHSFVIQAPPESGPKNIRMYKNLPKTLSFDEIPNTISIQDFEMAPLDLEKGNAIKLRYVRFQNVRNIQIFVQNNQSETNKTQINYIGFIGRPVAIPTYKEIAPIVTSLPSGSPKASFESTSQTPTEKDEIDEQDDKAKRESELERASDKDSSTEKGSEDESQTN